MLGTRRLSAPCRSHYRVSKAADLLIHTDLPIIDIAFETGFESANYFTIAFKNKTKVTPRESRSNHRQTLPMSSRKDLV